MEKTTILDVSKPKFYSLKGIGIATYIGSPLAASILIRKNFLELGEDRKAKTALIIGIASTILIFAGIYLLPETIIDKIPNFIIPAIYSFVIYFLAEKQLGEQLKQYQEHGNEFFSNWRAAGIGLLCALIIFIPLIGYEFILANDPVHDEYAQKFEKFSKNETASFEFYKHLDTSSPNQLRKELENLTIPYWEENKKIVQQLKEIDGLTPELLKRNEILWEYCDLRLQEYRIYDKYLMPLSSQKRNSIDSIHSEISKVLEKLN